MIHLENAERVLSQLEAIGHELGVKVRYENLEQEGEHPRIHSGYCRLRGSHLLLIDRRLSPLARCHTLARELRRFDLDGIFIPPLLRLLIQGKEGDF